MFFRSILIINSKIGQLGNSLLVSSHVIASAIENNLLVINIPFDDYAEFFIGTKNNLLCSYPYSLVYFPIYKKMMLRGRTAFLIRKLIKKMNDYRFFSEYYKSHIEFINIDWSERFSLESINFLDQITSKKVRVLNGWNFRAELNVRKHAVKIRSYFSPLPIYQRRVKNFLDLLNKKHDYIVGIHIRQSDYKRWHSGRFFYTVAIYKEIMQSIYTVLGTKKILFIVCSDVLQNEHFDNTKNVLFGSGHLIEDIYLLSKCDYIIGPPSTFSLWASFYGETPLYHIYDPSYLPKIQDFQVKHDLFWNL